MYSLQYFVPKMNEDVYRILHTTWNRLITAGVVFVRRAGEGMGLTATWWAQTLRHLMRLKRHARAVTLTWLTLPMGEPFKSWSLLDNYIIHTHQQKTLIETIVFMPLFRLLQGWTMLSWSAYSGWDRRNTFGSVSRTREISMILCGSTQTMWSSLTGMLTCQVWGYYYIW